MLISFNHHAGQMAISAITLFRLLHGVEKSGVNDLHIAAHARSEGLTLVSNNLRVFERVEGLLLENWAGSALWPWLHHPNDPRHRCDALRGPRCDHCLTDGLRRQQWINALPLLPWLKCSGLSMLVGILSEQRF
jgi:hypothetical protein